MEEREHIEQAMASWAQIDPDLDVATMRTAMLLTRVTALGHKYVEEAFTQVGLSAGEFDVLASLMHADDHTSTPTTLARTGMLSPAGMTHRLDLLERAGLIERRADPTDRRSTLVVLTAAGEVKAREAAQAHVALEAELLAPLGADGQAALRRLLETLIDAYDDALSSSAETRPTAPSKKPTGTSQVDPAQLQK